MHTKEFQIYLSKIDTLSHTQENHLKSLLHKRCNIKSIENLFNNINSCPHCKSQDFYKWGINAKIQRYKWKECNRTFNALTNTSLAHLRLKEHWNSFTQDLIEGKSIESCAKHNHISNNTSFRWRHRFLTSISKLKDKHLHGIVEADETFFLQSSKGKRNLKRIARRRGSGARRAGLSSEQIPVLIVRDRSGNMSDSVLKKANEKALIKSLLSILDKDVLLCTDGNNIYKAFTKHFKFVHKCINVSKHQYVNGAYHIQNVNAYNSRLKTWFKGFYGVSTKYLSNYLGWKRVLDKNKNLSSQEMLRMASIRINN